MSEHAIHLKTIFFGTGDLGLPSLQKLVEIGAKPLLVVTAPDKPAGRGLKLKHSAIKELALQAGIPVLQPENVNDPLVIDEIHRYNADLGVIIAYGQKIGQKLIDTFPHGIINLHASLLPKYRGAAPINWAIINGEEETGLTAMQINERIDAGKILNQSVIPIDPLIRADELHDKLAEMGPELLLKTIAQVQDKTLHPVSQDPARVTKAPKLSKAIAQIDWSLPAGLIADFIRGMWSWPKASSDYLASDGKRINVALARAEALKESAPAGVEPGTILDDFTIATGAGRLKLLEVKPAGSKLMGWQDFINGRRVQPGEKFVSVENSAYEHSTPL